MLRLYGFSSCPSVYHTTAILQTALTHVLSKSPDCHYSAFVIGKTLLINTGHFRTFAYRKRSFCVADILAINKGVLPNRNSSSSIGLVSRKGGRKMKDLQVNNDVPPAAAKVPNKNGLTDDR